MDERDKEEIRARTDIVELISGYTALKAGGGRFKGLCPFHQERTPSFTVDPALGRWHCFGACGEGGDIFKFVMKVENLTFVEAAERLAHRAGIPLSQNGRDPEAARQAQSEKDRLYAVGALAQRFYLESFQRATLAREYATGRGLVHATREAFGIGYAPDDYEALAGYLRANGARLDDAEKAGLVFAGRNGFTDRFRGRLMFPIVDIQERIVGFGGRLIVPSETAPKYLNSPETPVFSKSRTLYALNRARKAIAAEGRVLVVEGYMDAVACHQAGIENVVATLGTALTEHHVARLRQYAKTVILSFDADAAGIKAALKAASLFAEAGSDLAVRVLALPEGDDPDAILARGDVAGFRKAMDDAHSVAEFRLRALRRGLDLTDETVKMAYLKNALAIVGEVPSTVERDDLIRKLAPLHPAFAAGGGRAEESLRAEAQRLRGGAPSSDDLPAVAPAPRYPSPSNGPGGGYRRRFPAMPPGPTPPPEAGRALPDAMAKAERTLIRALLDDSWFALALEKGGGPMLSALFTRDAYLLLAGALLPRLLSRMPPSRAVVELLPGVAADTASALLLGDDGDPISETALLDCIACLERRQRQGTEREIQSRVEGGNALSEEELRRWLLQKKAEKRGGAPGPG
jgi:DNA primase